ncbi:MAG: bifunctional diaminohydroxyphosphoribosylaminopyrimidine deaminase/5-amino-6-(5-phosphoribosylamino)uracil reductase RibD [Planctomycetes bacterium]|nr:bifunctional diaminohydroxyphosphoribosylaminopyrimidine deaminase/5-amino-6-(5-phosphoribosylamino)uracil reductase RibD [Planctomycetota bacterium]
MSTPSSPKAPRIADAESIFWDAALGLACERLGFTLPNPTVGAVIVRDGRIIASAAHESPGTPHAEALAICRAGPAARGAGLYVTLEPCRHHGRTPPCTDAIIAAGITSVFILNHDPNPVAAGGADVLERAGVAVSFRCRIPQAVTAARLNAPFFKHVRTGLPFVTAKWAVSADDVMSVPGRNVRITGDAARSDAHRLRSTVSAILTGAGTVATDDPLFDTRFAGNRRSPVKIILDTELRTPAGARIFASGRTVIVHAPSPPPEKARALASAGAELVEVPRSASGLDLRSALKILASMGLIHVLLEAGPRLQSSFFDTGLVDRLVVYRSPDMLEAGDPPLKYASAPRPVLKQLSTDRLDRDIKYVCAVNPPLDPRLAYSWEEAVLCSRE